MLGEAPLLKCFPGDQRNIDHCYLVKIVVKKSKRYVLGVGSTYYVAGGKAGTHFLKGLLLSDDFVCCLLLSGSLCPRLLSLF